MANEYTSDSRTQQPGEQRSVDPRTGAEKGVKVERYDLIPTEPLRELARHYGLGAAKYDDNQWRAGYDWSKSYAALQRHLGLWWSGEDLDTDPSMPGATHLAAAAWHIFALLEFSRTFPEGDDRYRPAPIEDGLTQVLDTHPGWGIGWSPIDPTPWGQG
jgi:Domain of unknown function (DUF5664)